MPISTIFGFRKQMSPFLLQLLSWDSANVALRTKVTQISILGKQRRIESADIWMNGDLATVRRSHQVTDWLWSSEGLVVVWFRYSGGWSPGLGR